MKEKNDLLNKTLNDAAGIFPALEDILLARTGGGQGNMPRDKAAYRAVAPYLTLGKALEMWGISEELFFQALESAVPFAEEADYDVRKGFPPLVALLPCGLRNPFTRLFDSFIEGWGRRQESLIEGNVNHELSYYNYVETIDDPDSLPDLMITSDINTLFHKRFQEIFVDAGQFLPAPPVLNPLFARSGMVDPESRYSFIATNLLVLVADREKLGDRSLPKRWEDILDPAFSRSIAVRGEEDFFCHSVSLPYYLLYGREGLEKLAANIEGCYHPSEMVKLCNSPRPDSPSLFIMPWFFAKRIVNTDRMKIVFPEEGAFTSPISLFVKRGRADGFREVLEFLRGDKLARLCEDLWFPSAFSPESPSFPADRSLYWIGWDRVRNRDVAELKREIDRIYSEALDKERRQELTRRSRP